MSAEIIYSLSKIIHSLNEIAYKSNQSTPPMNENAFSINETCYPGLRMHPNLGKMSGYKYTTNLTVNPRWCWRFSRKGTISVTVSVPRGGVIIMGAQIWHDSPIPAAYNLTHPPSKLNVNIVTPLLHIVSLPFNSWNLTFDSPPPTGVCN